MPMARISRADHLVASHIRFRLADKMPKNDDPMQLSQTIRALLPDSGGFLFFVEMPPWLRQRPRWWEHPPQVDNPGHCFRPSRNY
eukprot:Skav229057  [mRNA]  locus=scaffold2611:15697:15951:- [translate_table: standard]